VLPVLFRLPEWLPIMGGAAITSFGAMMFLSFVVGGMIIRNQMAEAGFDPEKTWDLVFVAVLGGIVGARGYYLLLNWQDTLANPAGMLLSRGGLVWYGGFILATVLVIWQIRRLKLPLGTMADFTAPALALGYAVGRMGCFLVGDDYGRPTDSWVGIAFPEGAPPTRVDILERSFGITVDPALIEKYGDIIPVHPTQLYEVGMSTLIFFLLWRIRRHDRQPGWIFAIWLALAGVERFIVEIFRAKDDRFLGMFTIAQLISVGLIVVGVVLMQRLSGRLTTGTPALAGAGAQAGAGVPALSAATRARSDRRKGRRPGGG
jgi:phosphatidylglycerol---prolipoprotein diacylglyceryl transferase